MVTSLADEDTERLDFHCTFIWNLKEFIDQFVKLLENCKRNGNAVCLHPAVSHYLPCSPLFLHVSCGHSSLLMYCVRMVRIMHCMDFSSMEMLFDPNASLSKLVAHPTNSFSWRGKRQKLFGNNVFDGSCTVASQQVLGSNPLSGNLAGDFLCGVWMHLLYLLKLLQIPSTVQRHALNRARLTRHRCKGGCGSVLSECVGPVTLQCSWIRIILERRVGQWKPPYQLLQMLNYSSHCQEQHNQLLGLGGD